MVGSSKKQAFNFLVEKEVNAACKDRKACYIESTRTKRVLCDCSNAALLVVMSWQKRQSFLAARVFEQALSSHELIEVGQDAVTRC